MKLCKNCGEINTNDSLFCANCGKDSFVFQEEIFCSNCGAVNDKSFTHCTACGKPLAQPKAPVAPDGLTAPVAVNLRDEMTDLYGGTSSALDVTESTVCPSCGERISLSTIFCTKCGTNVSNLNVHKVVKRKICPHCNQPNPTDTPYCSYCFCSLADAQTVQMQVVHEIRNLGDVVVKQAMLDDGSAKKKICPNCSTLNGSDELFCINCGLKLEVDPPKKYCPNCGTENQGDSSFCIKCNWSFNECAPKGENWVCQSCQTENQSDSSFCTNCGTKRT